MQAGTVPVSAPIDTYLAGNLYPTHKASRGLGGYQVVADNTARDAISALRREEGMLVKVLATDLYYTLASDLTTWNPFFGGGITPADVMLKSVYDPNDDGSVVNSDALQGQTLAQVRDRATHTGVQAIATITGLQTALDNKIETSLIGVANGLVPTNAGNTIDPIYLGVTLSVPLEGWNATTNTPALSDGTGNANEYCFVTVAGTQDLGSGNLVCAIGNFLYHDGTKWNLVPTTGFGVNSITTALGLQTGSTTIDDTTYIDPSTDRNYVTDDQSAAFPAGASASDQLVLQSDLTSLIVVGNGYFMPELFSDGQVLGNGVSRLLNTLTSPATGLAYTNTSAGNYWTRVNSAFTIDVTTMTIDWIAWQEALLAMEQDAYSSISTPGGRGYLTNTGLLLPRTQLAWNANRRGLLFDFDFKGSAFINTTGVSFRQFDRYPVNQAEANSAFLDYSFKMRNAKFVGNGSTDESDCFVRLGATEGSSFEDIRVEDAGMGIDLQFCLRANLTRVNTVAYGKYGVAIRDGLWTGAGANTAQSNNVDVSQYRSVHGSGKAALAGIYCQGNRNINIRDSGFEGFSGAETQILYSQAYPTSGTLATTVKNVVYMESIDWENCGASRAGIRIIGNNITAELNRFMTQVGPGEMLVLMEMSAYNGINGGMTAVVQNSRNSNPGYKFRQLNNGGPTQKWEVHNLDLNNNSSLVHGDNWDTAFAGSSIPTTYRYTARL